LTKAAAWRFVPRGGLYVCLGDAGMIEYTESLAGIEKRHLHGFFVGWRYPLSPETHLRLLAGGDHIVLARDTESGQVVRFVTAVTDGVLSGFIPLLEVLPAYQGRGIGHALMERMLERLAYLPNVDLVCDPDLVPFYETFGMQRADAMMIRRQPS
jgi:GNAT superfamily N-acetyltransferase